MTERQERFLEELREQDEMIRKLFERREEIGRICRTNGDYRIVYDALFSDKKMHYGF